MIKLIFLFSAVLSFSDRYLCTCWPVTIEEAIQKADRIFIGKVLTIDSVNMIPERIIRSNGGVIDSGGYTWGYLVTLKLKKHFKGEYQSDTIHIMTGSGMGDCGYDFRLKNDYLVYADKQQYQIIDSIIGTTWKFKYHMKDYYTTNDCDRTTYNIKSEEKILKEALRKKSVQKKE